MYIVFFLLEFSKTSADRTLIIIFLVFFFKDILKFLYFSYFWLISYFCLKIPFLVKFWDYFLVQLFFFLLEFCLLISPFIYYVYVDYNSYIFISEMLGFKVKINFFYYLLFFSKKLKVTYIAQRALMQ